MDTKPLHVLDGYSNNLLQNLGTYVIAKYFQDTYKNMSHYVAGLIYIEDTEFTAHQSTFKYSYMI